MNSTGLFIMDTVIIIKRSGQKSSLYCTLNNMKGLPRDDGHGGVIFDLN